MRTATHDPSPEERSRLLDRVARALAGTPGIRLAYVFGSFARGEPFRDLDVAIWTTDRGDWRAFGRVEARLAEALGALPYPLDIVPLNDAPPSFRARVAREGRLVWEDAPGGGLEFQVQALSEHMDFQAFRRAHGMSA